MLLPLLMISCQSPILPQEPTKSAPSEQKNISDREISILSSSVLPSASGYYAADLDGDGEDEKIYYDETGLRTPLGLSPLEGGFQIAIRADRDQDGKEELIIATGAGKGARNAPMTISSVHQDGTNILWSGKQGSNQISDLHIFEKQKIFFVHSIENGQFGGSFIEGDAIHTVAKNKLALRMLPKSKTEVYVGRVYGDEPRSDGDLFLYKDGFPQQKIQNFRGIRALAFSDIDNDSNMELLVSDGWHYQYGTMARARVNIFPQDDAHPIPIVDLPKEYTINRIELHKKHHDIFLLQASRGAYILTKSSFGWKSIPICSYSEGNNATFRYVHDTTHVLCSGRKAKEYTLSITSK